MNALQEHLTGLFGLRENEAALFLSRFSRITLHKNELFMAEGTVCHKIGLIESGLMKCVYNQQGRETVFEFSWEKSFIADYYSFVTHTPAEKEIRCIEDTVVHVITRAELEKLAKEHAFIGALSRTINEKLFLRMHDRLKSMLLDSAAERYRKLLAEKSDLAQRVPQYLLASYLNVQPETISRIRKKLARQVS